MSNREKCISILDSFSEGQLVNIAAMAMIKNNTTPIAIKLPKPFKLSNIKIPP